MLHLARLSCITALILALLMAATALNAQTSPNPNAPTATSRPVSTEIPPTNTPEPTPVVDSCATSLQSNIVVTGAAATTQCSQIYSGSAGNETVEAAGVQAAVDIWGWTSTSVEVCFEGSGRVAFLDAGTAPRALSYPETTVRDGMTCVTISGPGTVVLTGEAASASAASDAVANDCQVTTQTTLYVRSEPNGQIVEITLPNTTLDATEYQQGWYKVRYWVDGWVSADWVATSGNCQ